MKSFIFLLFIIPAFAQISSSSFPDAVEGGRVRFNIRCAGCHGQDGLGGERAPAIGHGWRSRMESEAAIKNVIVQGIADAGMPAFNVPDAELKQLVAFLQSRVLPLAKTPVPGNVRAGEALFFGEGHCAKCHMVWGKGSLNGPDLTEAAKKLTLAEVETSLRNPDLRKAAGYTVAMVLLKESRRLHGFIRNESGADLQLQGFDGRLHLLRKSEITSVQKETHSSMPLWTGTREQTLDLIAFLSHVPEWQPGPGVNAVPALPGRVEWKDIAHPRLGEWPTYHGQLGGNRYSELSQITPANVENLAPKWMFPLGGGRTLEVTPVVMNGVMYVTKVNSTYALDARAGRQIWEYTRPPSKDLVGDAAGGINRGVAVLGDSVFLVTDNAHLLALHRLTGGLLWDAKMADSTNTTAHVGASRGG